jgi:hypothetical protein
MIATEINSFSHLLVGRYADAQGPIVDVLESQDGDEEGRDCDGTEGDWPADRPDLQL